MYKLLKYISIFVLALCIKNSFSMNELEIYHNEDDEIAKLEFKRLKKLEIKKLKADIRYIDNEIDRINAKIDYNQAIKRGEKLEKPEKSKKNNKIAISVENALDALINSSRGPVRMPSHTQYNKKGDLARYTRKKFEITGVNGLVDPIRGCTPIHAIFNSVLFTKHGKTNFQSCSPRSLRNLNQKNIFKRSLYALWMWGAHLDTKDKDGNTALHHAGSILQPKSIKLLCKMNPNGVNVTNDEGTTAHHYMYEQNQNLLYSNPVNLRLLKCQTAFINSGSKPNKNIFGESVESYLQFTQERKDKEEASWIDWLTGQKTEKNPLLEHYDDRHFEELEKEFELI